MTPRPATNLHCICDPHGNLIFTAISTDPKDCIEILLHEQQTVEEIANIGRVLRGEKKTCCPSWEQFEAEGYTIVPVAVIPSSIEPQTDRMSK